jgi:anti-anti-sigma regulatory factor
MCDGELYVTRSQPRNGSTCPFCRMPLWFLRKSAEDIIILTFLADGKQKSAAVSDDSILWVLQNAAKVVVNLSRIPYLADAMPEILASLQKKLLSTGGSMKVCGLQPEADEQLKESDMHGIFELFPDETSAVESFNSPVSEDSSALPIVSEFQSGLTTEDLAVSGSMT